MPYLDSPDNRTRGAIDVELEVLLQSVAMRERGQEPVRLSHSNYRDAYWTVAQMLAHHTVNGCNLQPGDLLGTGTLSGPKPEQGGSLLELGSGGWHPVILPGGETRSFLLDGDCLTLRAWCERKGARRIGFGSCSGTIEPALAWPPS
jgi:fumarylacetoacetase